MKTFNDDELLKFCEWYADYHGTGPVSLSTFTTCVCGHLHTFTKAAEAAVKRLAELGVVKISKKIVNMRTI